MCPVMGIHFLMPVEYFIFDQINNSVICIITTGKLKAFVIYKISTSALAIQIPLL